MVYLLYYMSKKKGFTFIEVIVVVVMLAIVTIIVIPRIYDIGEARLDMAVDKVASDLKYAREFAINNNGRTRVRFITASERYVVEFFNVSGGVWEAVEDPSIREDFDVRLGQGVYAGVDITGASFDGTAEIIFDSIGAPHTAAGPLNGTGSVNLRKSGGGAQSAITVEAVTGAISIAR